MKNIRLYFCLTILILLAGCSSQDFPGSPPGTTPGFVGATDERDISFRDTFLFNFKTGVGPIATGNPDGNLQIVSQADLLTLLAAAQDQQLLGRGVVSGQVLFNGAPVKDVALKVTDEAGNLLAIRIEGEIEGTDLRLPDGSLCPSAFVSFDTAGNITSTLCESKTDPSGNTPQGSIYYNSPGGVPDFSNNKGTSSAGTFTIFNLLPGDVYIWASRGGRGNTRIKVFANKISVGKLQVIPIPVATTSVTGNVVEAKDGASVSGAIISILGTTPALSTISLTDGSYTIPSIGANGNYLMEVAKTGHWTTYHQLNTAPFQGTADIPGVNLDGQLYADAYITEISSGGALPSKAKGLIAGRVKAGDGTPQHCAKLTVTDGAGADLTTMGAVIFYLAGDRSNCSTPADLNQTSSNGLFIIYNLPPGEVFVKYVAKVSTGSPGNQNVVSGGMIASAFGGVVFVQDMFNSGSAVSQELSGQVNDEGDVASPDTQITILGITDRIYNGALLSAQAKSDGLGAYLIPKNAVAEDPPYPLVGGTIYRVKTSKAGLPDTYQTIRMVNAATKQNLVTLSTSTVTATTGEIYGTLINQATGRLAKDVELEITDLSGSLIGVGTGMGAGVGKEISADGTFTIQNLPPGLVNLKVTSGDDSGNLVVRVYPNGVSFVEFPMAKVIPETVTVSGTVKDLAGMAIDSPNLTILGRKGVASGSGTGNYTLNLESNGRFVIKTERSGSYDTYNFFPKTGIVDTAKLDLFSVLLSEITGNPAGAGIVAGKTVENRFDLISSSTGCGITGTHAAVSGFFNQDTIPDIAVTNCNAADRVTVLFGNTSGDGTFALDANYSVGTNPTAIALGDFDGNGISDLVVANNGDDPATGAGISVLLGGKKGKFTLVADPLLDKNNNKLPVIEDLTATPPIIGIPSPINQPVDLAVGLFDSDTVADIAIANAGDSKVLIFLGNGDGSFRPNVDLNGDPIPIDAGGVPTAIVAGNFNSDLQNKLDLAIATAANGILVVHGNTDGTFQAPNDPSITNPITDPSLTNPKAMVAVDLTSDGIQDLAVVSGINVVILTGNTSGAFDKLEDAMGNLILIPVGTDPSSITIGEFNGDNRFDLAVADADVTGDQVFVLLGSGDGTFTASPAFPASGIMPEQVLSASIDSNNLLDLIVVGTGIGSLLGSEKPVGGVQVEVRDMEGLSPLGTVAYLDCSGLVVPAFTVTQSCSSPNEDQGGTFVILNVPPGLSVVRSSGTSAAGNSILNTFADSVSFTKVNTISIPPFQVSVDGVTYDPVGPPPAGRPVGSVNIDVLGTGVTTKSSSVSGSVGDFSLNLDANSEFILNLVFDIPLP